jgi:hypothetical protein
VQDLFITLDQFEGLDEAGQALYVKETDGKGYMLKLNINREGWGIENVAGLKTVLNERKEKMEKQAAALEKFEGIDPTRAKKDRELVAEFESKDWTKDEKVKAQIESRELALTTKHETERAKLTEENGSLTSQLHEHLGTASAVTAIQKHKGNVKLLLPHVLGMTRVEPDDAGKLTPRVINPDGSLRVSLQTGNTGLMDHDELLGLIAKQDEFLPAFDGTGQSGTGAGGPESRAGRRAGSGKFILSLEDQKDHRKYQAMKEQAEAAKQELILEQPPIVPSAGT